MFLLSQNDDSRGHDKVWTRLFFLLAAGAFLTAACGAKNFADLRRGIEERGHYIEAVPFYRQTESTCGVVALAGVLAFWGHSANLEDITSKVYIPGLRGTLPMDIESYARGAGFQTEARAGSLEQLKQAIRRNLPVICLTDHGFSLYRKPHYIIATGFDDQNRTIIMHDGMKPDRTVGYDTFDGIWKRAGNWMIVISPAGPEARHEQ